MSLQQQAELESDLRSALQGFLTYWADDSQIENGAVDSRVDALMDQIVSASYDLMGQT